jgi:type IV pilus assembly protein PilW
MKIHLLKNSDTRGFTIAELMVGIALSGVVLATIFSSYYSQRKAYSVQDQLAAMVQNLRSGMDIMVREIRMAGYDPTGTANAGIITADTTSINVTEDIDGNGTIAGNEDVTYSIADTDSDGDNDLERNSTLAAENVDALNFVYLNGTGSPTTTPSEIRSVQITMVARTGKGDPGYKDTEVYRNQQGTPILGPVNDNCRRKRLTVEVRCRNLGLD